MRIEEFSILHYGPLANTGRVKLKNFNLFWGKNEEGKSLTIDAIVKMLFGRSPKEFEKLDRVEELPEGYLIVENDEKKSFKIPENGYLPAIIDLSPGECSNIFIVRDSNLAPFLDKSTESNFYLGIIDHLTGLRTGEIEKIKKELLDIGNITPTFLFKDTKEERIRSRWEDAKTLLQEIENLEIKIKSEDLDELEKISVLHTEQIRTLEVKLASIADAQKREKYEICKKAFNILKESLQNIEALEIYNKEDFQAWRDCEKEILESEKRLSEFKNELKNKVTDLENINEKYDEITNHFQMLETRKIHIDEIKNEIKEFQDKSIKLKSDETRDNFFAPASLISSLLLLASLIGMVINPIPIFVPIFSVLIIITIVLAFFHFSFLTKKARLASDFEKILFISESYGVGGEEISKIISNIQSFDEDFEQTNSEKIRLNAKKENMDEDIKELRTQKIPNEENSLQRSKNNIEVIKQKTGETTIEGYELKLELLQSLEKEISEQSKILKSHFDYGDISLEEGLYIWEEEIKNIETYKDRALDTKYNVIDENQYKQQKTEVINKQKEISIKIEELKKSLKDIERKANAILKLDEPIICDYSSDLIPIHNRLQSFIETLEENKQNAIDLISIFNDIAKEEQTKISELFGKDSLVSRYFSEITEDNYKEVDFDQNESKIFVTKMNGHSLTADKLSGGTYDQLYFAIRCALGEKLLKGNKGFFILDDPFIKADPDRINRQLLMLKTLTQNGWQILYFSSKGEIKDALEAEIETQEVNYLEMPGLSL
ncbi:MAG TPA: AAA family ATPase [bacterium]|nr:AAA family ATPase [bacterium]